jgi:hypothetical protein
MRAVEATDHLDQYSPDSGQWRHRFGRLELGLRILDPAIGVFLHDQLSRHWQHRSRRRH